MHKYYIPHKLSIGDITNLSDSDSELINSQQLYKIEDMIEIETPDSFFLAQVTNIDPSSVEIEIIDEQERESKPSTKKTITLLQSLSNDRKFELVLEKATEIGVSEIIPFESKYSLLKQKNALKKVKKWNEIIRDAAEQSRNKYPPILHSPVKLSTLKLNQQPNETRLCLATEQVDSEELAKAIKTKSSKVTIAIGPERGWDSSDLRYFQTNSFKFVSLPGNILRTETAAIVVSALLKYCIHE